MMTQPAREPDPLGEEPRVAPHPTRRCASASSADGRELVLGFPVEVLDQGFGAVAAVCGDVPETWACSATREEALAIVESRLKDHLGCQKPADVDCFDWCTNWNGYHTPCGMRVPTPERRTRLGLPAGGGGEAGPGALRARR